MPRNVPPLNILGTENHPDLSMFDTTLKGNVRCTVCGRIGQPESVWVFACLAGHPAVCSAPACGKAFTTTGLLARHMWNKHPDLVAWLPDETMADRHTRLRRERRKLLRKVAA
jgi:hypothetical protein